MKKVALTYIIAISLVACSASNSTTGSTSKPIDLNTAATIGCALAQVVGATAGGIAGNVGAGQSTLGTIDKARAVTDTTCDALIKLGGVVKQATQASVSATTN